MRTLTFIAILVFGGILQAQEQGFSMVRNFTPDEYRGGADNWSVIQDERGVIYTANDEGIFEYDGIRWRRLPVENASAVRWFTKDRQGRIFVAVQGDFGWIRHDARGVGYYQSLISKSARDSLKLGDVWECEATSRGVYFRARKQLVRWDEGTLRVWELPVSASRFDVLGVVRDTLYLRLGNIGLMRMDGDSLVLLNDGVAMADLKINVTMPLANGLLIATRRDGLFRYDGNTFSIFRTPLNDYFKKHSIYNGTRLRDGRFVLATLHGGIVVMDSTGALITIFDRSNDLQDNSVNCVYEDREGGLWLGLVNGVSRIGLRSDDRILDVRNGLNGIIRSIVRHEGRLYAATSNGVFRMETGDLPNFKAQLDTPGNQTGLLSSGRDFFVMGSGGTFWQDERKKLRRISPSFNGVGIRLRCDSNRIVTTMQDGILVIRKKNDQWVSEGRLAGVDQYTTSFAEDSSGFLWVGTSFQGLLRIDFRKGFTMTPMVERFGTGFGLPEGPVDVYDHHGAMLFSTRTGFYEWLDKEKRFDPMPLPEDKWKSSDAFGDFLLRNRHIFLVTKRAEANLILHKLWNLNYSRDVVYWKDTDGLRWIGTHDRILQMRLPKERPATPPITMIRSVRIADSVIYGGFGAWSGFEATHTGPDLTIEYAVAKFETADLPMYQYYLEGWDREWSAWTREASRRYAGLADGQYVFHVRAIDVYDQIGPEVAFSIRIPPPWYRSLWAYLVYTLVLGGIVVTGMRIRLRVLRGQNVALENLVTDRTRALRETESQLVQSEKMAAVGQMVAGVLHEVNNPLTFIQPNLEYVRSELDKSKANPDSSQEVRAALESAIHGSDRIRDIMMNLRAFDSARSSERVETDLETNLSIVVDLFFNQYHDLRIEQHFGGVPTVKAYVQDLNQCFVDILKNAVQAVRDAEETSVLEKGKGVIIIETHHNGTPNDRSITISFRDNGIGMPAAVVPRIFDPFFTTRPIGQGRGLGLSESYAIIQKHEGRITAQSSPNKGTTITIELPIR